MENTSKESMAERIKNWESVWYLCQPPEWVSKGPNSRRYGLRRNPRITQRISWVTTWAQWDEREKNFFNKARSTGLVSFDLEKCNSELQTVINAQKDMGYATCDTSGVRPVFAVIGSGAGEVMILALKRLFKETEEIKMPDKLGEIFRSGEVLIVGSKIREDLERYFVGISPGDILDTRDLFSYALHSKRFFDVEPGMRAKSGLAVQAFSLYGSIVSWHKPMKRREDFEYLFGEMKNTVGPQKWSEMCSDYYRLYANMYKWGLIKPGVPLAVFRQEYYMFMDGVVPCFFVQKYVAQMFKENPDLFSDHINDLERIKTGLQEYCALYGDNAGDISMQPGLIELDQITDADWNNPFGLSPPRRQPTVKEEVLSESQRGDGSSSQQGGVMLNQETETSSNKRRADLGKQKSDGSGRQGESAMLSSNRSLPAEEEAYDLDLRESARDRDFGSGSEETKGLQGPYDTSTPKSSLESGDDKMEVEESQSASKQGRRRITPPEKSPEKEEERRKKAVREMKIKKKTPKIVRDADDDEYALQVSRPRLDFRSVWNYSGPEQKTYANPDRSWKMSGDIIAKLLGKDPPERDSRFTLMPALKGCFKCGFEAKGGDIETHKQKCIKYGKRCEWCNRTGHLIYSCRKLAHVCANCRLRGHWTGVGCPSNQQEGGLEKYKNDFEEHADKNKITCRRHKIPYYGIFLFPRKYQSFKYCPFTYDELIKQSIHKARGIIDFLDWKQTMYEQFEHDKDEEQMEVSRKEYENLKRRAESKEDQPRSKKRRDHKSSERASSPERMARGGRKRRERLERAHRSKSPARRSGTPERAAGSRTPEKRERTQHERRSSAHSSQPSTSKSHRESPPKRRRQSPEDRSDGGQDDCSSRKSVHDRLGPKVGSESEMESRRRSRNSSSSSESCSSTTSGSVSSFSAESEVSQMSESKKRKALKALDDMDLSFMDKTLQIEKMQEEIERKKALRDKLDKELAEKERQAAEKKRKKERKHHKKSSHRNPEERKKKDRYEERKRDARDDRGRKRK